MPTKFGFFVLRSIQPQATCQDLTCCFKTKVPVGSVNPNLDLQLCPVRNLKIAKNSFQLALKPLKILKIQTTIDAMRPAGPGKTGEARARGSPGSAQRIPEPRSPTRMCDAISCNSPPPRGPQAMSLGEQGCIARILLMLGIDYICPRNIYCSWYQDIFAIVSTVCRANRFLSSIPISFPISET